MYELEHEKHALLGRNMPYLIIVTWTFINCLFRSMLLCSIAFCQVISEYCYNLFNASQIGLTSKMQMFYSLLYIWVISVFMAVVIVATIVLLCSLNGKLGIAANGGWYIHIKSYHESEMSCACINILLEFKFKPLWYNIYIHVYPICWKIPAYGICVFNTNRNVFIRKSIFYNCYTSIQ